MAWSGNYKRVGAGGAKCPSRWALQDGSPGATRAVWIFFQGHKQWDAKSDMHLRNVHEQGRGWTRRGWKWATSHQSKANFEL